MVDNLVTFPEALSPIVSGLLMVLYLPFSILIFEQQKHGNIRFISKVSGTWDAGRKSPKYFVTWKNKLRSVNKLIRMRL